MTDLKIIIKGIDNASGAFKSAGRSLDALEGKTGKAHKALGAFGGFLSTGLKVAAGAAAVGLGALAVGIGKATMAAADMEQGVADIAAVMGLAADEVGPLKNLITDLGLDPKLKVNATEAAQAIEMLAKNGLTMTDIMDGAARNTVLLANATGGDFGVAADIATDAMALFGIKAADMKQAVDGISAVTLSSKFDIGDYGLALAQAGGVASVVGVSFDDFNTTIAAISPFFASGSDAGTSFKTMLQRLIPASNPARDAMRDLGLFTGLSKSEFADAQDKIAKYTDQLAKLDPESKTFVARSEELQQKISVLQGTLVTGSNAFFDASGNMKDMAEISGILNTAMSGLSEEQKNEALATIFGTDAMRAAAAMAGMTEDEFLKLKGTMAKTDAEQQAATRMNTLRGSMEILTGVFDTLKIGIGEKFIPVFKQLIDKATVYLSNAGPGLVAWAGDMATKLGALIEKYLPIIIEKFGEWWEAGKRILPTIIEMGRQVGEFAASAGRTMVEIIAFVSGNQTEFDNLKRHWETVKSAASNLFGALISHVTQSWPVWRDQLQEWGKASWQWITNIAIPIAKEKMTEWGNQMLGFLAANLPGWIAATLDWAAGLTLWIDEALVRGINAMTRWMGGVTSWAQNDGKRGIGTATNGWWEKFLEWVDRDLIPKVGPALQRFLQAAQAHKPQLEAALGALGRTLGAAIWEGVKSAIFTGPSGGGMGGLMDIGFKNPAEEWGRQSRLWLIDKGKSIIGWIVEGTRGANLQGDFAGALGGLTIGFDSWVNGFKTHVYGPARDIANRIMDGINDIDLAGKFGDKLYQIADAFNNFTSGFWNHVYQPMKDIGGHIIDGIADGLRDAWGRLQDALSWIASVAPQWIKDALGISSPSKIFADIGKWIPPGIAEGIMQTSDAPLTALTDMFGQMTALPATGGGGGGMGDISTVNNTTTNFNVSMPGGNRGGSTSQQTKGLVDQLVAIYA